MTMMFRKYYLALCVVALASCRSERVAFQFSQPRTATAATTVTEPTPVTSPVKPLQIEEAPATSPVASSARAGARPAARHLAAFHPRKHNTTAAHRSVRPTVVTPPPRQFSRPRKALLENEGAFVLGALLVVAGITAGVVLGGWLGFGVGALVVLFGYYFLGVGIGGKRAWLEVFQEFFNM